MVERHQHPKQLLRIGILAADKAMRGKRPSERVFKQAERAAFKAIIVADPQAGTSSHKYRGARYSHGVSTIAHRAAVLARRLNWTAREPEWSKRVYARDPQKRIYGRANADLIRWTLRWAQRADLSPDARAHAIQLAHEMRRKPRSEALDFVRVLGYRG